MKSLVQERILLRGRVQGVGMRPFLYRQATRLDLCGDARNTEDGIEMRVQGPRDVIDRLVVALRVDPPPHAVVRAIERTDLSSRPCGEGFRILSSALSSTTAAIHTALPPDRATCADCLAELFDPADRRHRHPFISCTDCGPRHSIVLSLPWDRCRNTMASFPLCANCQREVDDPEDRRFHSQTNCCPDCGPRLSLRESGFDSVHEGTPALDRAVALLAQGGLLAVKGLGGFHLMARADQSRAIARIRQLKRRQRKPLAVMFATPDSLARYCRVSEAEQQQLCAAMAPIVLLQHRVQLPFISPLTALFISPLAAPVIDPLVAPGLDRLGAMLAYTPLHHLLLQGVGVPLLATSANPRGEPLCYRNDQAIDGFADNVDAVLFHDRDIQHPLDDSIVQLAAARPMTLRRARGFDLQCAELESNAVDSLAVGADLKNCIALNRGREILGAPHIGDLNSLAAEAAHGERSRNLCQLYGLQPQQVVCDLHPAYSSRRLAIESGLPLHAIQHHRAHLYAVLAENPRVPQPLLAAIWDGTGYGDDGTVWGGEFFLLDQHGDRRLACLAPFHLPGGEQAIREPRRMALSLLFAVYGEAAMEHPALPHFTAEEKQLLVQMLRQQINSPLCSSAGRLFDGVAALLGIHPRVDYEGEAAICLEQLAARHNDSADLSPYPIELDRKSSVWQLDWRPMVHQLAEEAAAGHVRAEQIAARFHLSLAHGILAVASAVGSADLLVGGGCFQNRLLLETVLRLASECGIRLHWPRDLPPGDGAIATGQLYALLS